MRLIDADALEYQMLYKENWLKGTGVEAPAVWKQDIDDAPTIDAVPVVRCKDCVHFDLYRRDDGYGFCKVDGLPHENDWFCKSCERKDGDA